MGDLSGNRWQAVSPYDWVWPSFSPMQYLPRPGGNASDRSTEAAIRAVLARDALANERKLAYVW